MLGFSGDAIGTNCISLDRVVSFYERSGGSIPWNRLLISQALHADDHHLYYNMLSFLYKGINLEQDMGSFAFFVLLVYSWLGSSAGYLMLSWLVGDGTTCAVGLSAVIFALKYVWNSRSDGYTHVMGKQAAKQLTFILF